MDVVDGLDTQHKGVVLVADLVSPAAEAASRVDAEILELGQELLQDTLTLQGRGGVSVVKGTVVGGDNLVLGLEHLSVDETLDAVLEKVVHIHGLQGGL